MHFSPLPARIAQKNSIFGKGRALGMGKRVDTLSSGGGYIYSSSSHFIGLLTI